MGMHGFVLRVSQGELDQFIELAKPAPPEDATLPPGMTDEAFDRELERMLAIVLAGSARGNSPERIQKLVRNAAFRQDMLARKYGKQAEKKVVSAFLVQRQSRALPLEKTFHALHWLITGQTWGGDPPLANAVLGGKEYGPDLGYGSVRYLEPAEVNDVAPALERLDVDTLLTRWNVKAMKAATIYAVADKDGREECAVRYPQLQAYFAEAARQREGMLSYIL
jgi:hypothetical protein